MFLCFFITSPFPSLSLFLLHPYHTCTSYSGYNNNNDVSLEIKRRVTHANRCYFGLNRQMSSRDLSRAMKLTLYKALILLMLLYDAEA